MASTSRLRSFLVLVLLGAHVWLAPFAHADPPDPLWMGGIFDDADYDDVVLLVMAMTAFVDSRPVFSAPTQDQIFVEPVPHASSDPIPARTRSIRAPPTA